MLVGCFAFPPLPGTVSREERLAVFPRTAPGLVADAEVYWSDELFRLLSLDPESLTPIAREGLGSTWDREEPRPILWTDDYSNLLQVIDW